MQSALNAPIGAACLAWALLQFHCRQERSDRHRERG